MFETEKQLTPLPGSFALEIAHRLKECRKQEGLSQVVFSQKAGISLGSLRRFEQTGEISFLSFLKIAFALERFDELEHLFTERRFKTLAEAVKNYEKTRHRHSNV